MGMVGRSGAVEGRVRGWAVGCRYEGGRRNKP
jgi:hypothetical protein